MVVEQSSATVVHIHQPIDNTIQTNQKQQSQGALRLADGGRPLPPFKAWSFTPARYCQYLADMAAVHGAVEEAVGGAAGGQASCSPSAAVTAALAHLGPSSGLHRGEQLRQDLAAMQQAVPAATASSSSNDSSSGSKAPLPASAGGSSVAFAAYMRQLSATAVSAAASGEERDKAALRLLACAYSLLSTFHSLGTRVGAAAAERSGAAAAGALRSYMDYPGLKSEGGAGAGGGGGGRGRDPAAALVAAVDAAGAALSPAQCQAVYDEIQRCFPKAALMVAALAHED
jgi:hypothetical protein